MTLPPSSLSAPLLLALLAAASPSAGADMTAAERSKEEAYGRYLKEIHKLGNPTPEQRRALRNRILAPAQTRYLRELGEEASDRAKTEEAAFRASQKRSREERAKRLAQATGPQAAEMPSSSPSPASSPDPSSPSSSPSPSASPAVGTGTGTERPSYTLDGKGIPPRMDFEKGEGKGDLPKLPAGGEGVDTTEFEPRAKPSVKPLVRPGRGR